MDRNEEYHDPDYAETSAGEKETPPSLTEDEKIVKIKNIIRREFSEELEVRESEVMLIDQKVTIARRMLQRLRYSLVNKYYGDQRLQISNSQIQDELAAHTEPRARAEVSSILLESQRRIHPSVKKLLGKQSVDIEEIFKIREPRNKARKNYSAMVQTRNVTIPADKTKSLRPEPPEAPAPSPAEDPSTSRPKKIPRRFEPRMEKVMTLDEATRNQLKHRYRFIIGNTSKYVPPASKADRSTHKWLLYVRGPPTSGGDGAAIERVLTAVTARLHHSYAPHHTVRVHKPPFHISRRGWGEFPAKVELHFALPERNRPVTVEHTIKLDRNYTGLQTLGAETIVDVWLYSTPDMLEFEYKEHIPTSIPTDKTVTQENIQTDDTNTQASIQTDTQANIQTDTQAIIKPEPMDTDEMENDTSTTHDDSWLDFFNTDTTELDIDEMIIKPVKKTKMDERNDLENLIETSVIKKESVNINDNIFNIHDENAIILDGNNYETTDYDYRNLGKPDETLPNEILSQPVSPKKRIMKYMDPTTGKIYYLEMDRNLDLTKVQEIVINSKGNTKTAKISPIKPNGVNNVKKTKKAGVSLLKPEIKSLLKPESNTKHNHVVKLKSFSHIGNDHCYLGAAWSKSVTFITNIKNNTVPQITNTDSVVSVKKEKNLYDRLCLDVKRFNCVKVCVNYLLKKIPLISDQARDPDFVRHFPFAVENDEKYWKLDFAKRRNIEWSRAKLINRILNNSCKLQNEIWRTKQILIYSRLHGYYPIRQQLQNLCDIKTEDWSTWDNFENSRQLESNIRELYPKSEDISTLSIYDIDSVNKDISVTESLDLTDSDHEIDVVSEDCPVKVKKEVSPDKSDSLTVLPVENDEDRLRFLYIERQCADLGIELRNEDVGHGYSYSAVHAVMLSAVKSFAEQLVREALAAKLAQTRDADGRVPVWTGTSSSRQLVGLEHLVGARPLVSRRGLGAPRKDTHAI